MKRIAIIGGGAAGCFCAANIVKEVPGADVTVYESGPSAMAKLALTGGGRCNITNSFASVDNLRDVYPRGYNLMKRALSAFGPRDTVAWFENAGVRLYTQPDGRVFPVSDDAREVVGTLSGMMRRGGVKLRCGSRVASVVREDGFKLNFTDGSVGVADILVIASGGGTAALAESLGAETVPAVPSLYTFRIEDSALRALMGSVAPEAVVGIAGTGFRASGPLLVTDWGVSGPAVLRLSSYAARHLAERGWKSALTVNWTGSSEDGIRRWAESARGENASKFISSVHPDGLSDRFWKHILNRAGLREDARWSEVGAKVLNRLVSALTADTYAIAGKGSYKEEFVTCGGVSLSSVDPGTMESRNCSGLFFAGEVLDVDAVTGGFNLQAAWSTAYSAYRKILLYL